MPGLYEAEVALEDDTPEAREEAFASALDVVVARLSGRRALAEPTLDSLRGAAGRFVQQFTRKNENRLWVAFNGPVLERALREAGLPVWGGDRPALLVWLVVDSGAGRALVGADDPHPARAALEGAAAQRGLPLVWPLLDAADRATVTAADVWGGFSDKINAASRRYGADAVLTARVNQRRAGVLFGRFELQTGSGAHFEQGDARAALSSMGDFLATRLAVTGDTRSLANITISGIRSVDDYARALAFLERVSLIGRVGPVTVVGDTVVFEAELRGDPARVSQALAVRAPFSPESEPGLLLFRMR